MDWIGRDFSAKLRGKGGWTRRGGGLTTMAGFPTGALQQHLHDGLAGGGGGVLPPWPPSPPVPCSSTCVMVQRSPDSMEAVITNTNPRASNCVSPFTIRANPSEITPTTRARCQFGLHPFQRCQILPCHPQPDTVCEVGGSTPDLSYGDLGIFLGGGQTEKLVH